MTVGLKEQRPLSIPSFFVVFLSFCIYLEAGSRAVTLNFFIVKNRFSALYCHVYVIHMPEVMIILSGCRGRCAPGRTPGRSGVLCEGVFVIKMCAGQIVISGAVNVCLKEERN